MSIKGNTVGTTMPRPDWNQTDPKKANYIRNKPNLSEYAKTAEVPTKTSQLANDSGFITNAVTNLANYYLKSETYTRDEVKNLLSAIPKFSIQVVSSLPTTDISTTTVYLLKSGDESDNLYTEYIYVDGAWEYLGKQTVDLTGYALKTDIPTKLSALADDIGYVTRTALSNALAGYAQKAATLAGYGITDAATKEQFETLSNEKVDKTGITLDKHTDGLIYIFVGGVPVGNGIEVTGEVVEGDVNGTLDENNNILLSGDIPIGTYTLAFVNADGTLTGTGSLVVSEIEEEPEPAEPTNFADPTSADWINGSRLSYTGSGLNTTLTTKAVDGCAITNYVDFVKGDIIKVEGINFTDSNNRQGFFYSDGTLFGGVSAVSTWDSTIASDTTYDANSLQFTTISDTLTKARFSGLLTGTANDVVITITRNGVVL